jgi:hypothetical protein
VLIAFVVAGWKAVKAGRVTIQEKL